MEFTVFEIAGYGENKETHEWTVPLFGDNCEDGETPKTPFWVGSIKWDGCSNWDFRTNECMAHFCGPKHATSIGRLMGKLYDLARTMNGWSEADAE
jgi:hypothetical protein